MADRWAAKTAALTAGSTVDLSVVLLGAKKADARAERSAG
jgi:hypothetical protein